jgi:hypothetical protein
MTIAGVNLLIISKELNLKIIQYKTYRLDAERRVSIYDTDYISELLCIPNEFYALYNAWVTIPGEYTGLFKETKKIKIRDTELVAPEFVMHVKKSVVKADDIFSYVLKQYFKDTRIFDVIWTIARLNGLNFIDFLDKYAIEW